MRVGVVGAGIIGLGSAVRLQDAFPELDLTLISDKFTPDTTGNGSAGFWDPVYLGEKNDKNKLRKWGKETYNYIKDIWKSEEAGPLGVSLVTSVDVSTLQKEDHFWKDDVLHYRHMSDSELKTYEEDEKLSILLRAHISNASNGIDIHNPGENRKIVQISRLANLHRCGVEYITFICEPTLFLPHLMRRYTSRGGKIFERKVTNLQSLSDRFDVIVNCCGLGARTVVPDEKVYPIRGQVMRVVAPQVKMCLYFDGGGPPHYCLVNRDTVVLGGTTQHNNWNLQVDPDDERRIREGACKINPQLKSAKKLKDWVGLRLGRESVRLEREVLQGKMGPFQVIHNYGHGGAGVTLFWGCAADVVNLMQDCIDHLSSSVDPVLKSNKLLAKL